jgi:hypothetical protein
VLCILFQRLSCARRETPRRFGSSLGGAHGEGYPQCLFNWHFNTVKGFNSALFTKHLTLITKTLESWACSPVFLPPRQHIKHVWIQ